MAKPSRIAVNFSSVRIGGGKTYFDRFMEYISSEEFNKEFPNLHLLIFSPWNKDFQNVNITLKKIPNHSFAMRMFSENILIPFYCLTKGYRLLYCPADLIPLLKVVKSVCLARNANLYLKGRYSKNLWENLRIFILRKLTKFSLRFSDKVIFVSETLQKIASHSYPSLKQKYSINPHGVNPPGKFQVVGKFQKYTPYMVYVSSIYHFKNFEDAIRALALLSEQKIKYLLIAGSIIERRYYQDLQKIITDLSLEQRVVFLGEINNKEELEEVYQGAEICLSTSLLESFGNTPFESIKRGKKTVVSDIQVFQEFFREKYKTKLCYFYPASDYFQLAKTICKALDSPEEALEVPHFPTWNESFRRVLKELQEISQ